ncbi:MAG: hypothetical protein K0S33_3798 [Bacteroidetes bacterium]|jgi:hypothetical protein|nr:hypothetical protein [Bacteroidota bacterium]
MSSNTETGHAKNVANFEDLISFCTTYGAQYNPGSAAITLAALHAKNQAAAAAMQNLRSAKNNLEQATNDRELIFADLRKRAARIVSALTAFGVPAQVVKDARLAKRKIYGVRSHSKTTKADAGRQIDPETPVTPVDPPDGEESVTPEEPKTISVSQQSYDSLIDHFDRLATRVAIEPAYTPNEADLQVTGLNTYLAALKAANTAVINATSAYSYALIARDAELYAKGTGLVDITLNVKQYVRSVFGSTSSEYRRLSALTFRRQ